MYDELQFTLGEDPCLGAITQRACPDGTSSCADEERAEALPRERSLLYEPAGGRSDALRDLRASGITTAHLDVAAVPERRALRPLSRRMSVVPLRFL